MEEDIQNYSPIVMFCIIFANFQQKWKQKSRFYFKSVLIYKLTL